MIKIVVTGAAGRMGGRIIHLILNDMEAQLTGAVEVPGSSSIGNSVGSLRITDSLEDVLSDSDVLIDFTLPQATLTHLETVARFKKAAVVGTTGHNDGQLRKIEAFGGCIPLVFAPNMSMGVNVMWKVLGDMVQVIGADATINIHETHHLQKKDRPSGTAKEIQRILEVKSRGPVKIQVESRREGNIVGIHSTTFDLPQESLTIVHEAKSRDAFALGALNAAKWIVGKPKGLYTMGDVLGLK